MSKKEQKQNEVKPEATEEKVTAPAPVAQEQVEALAKEVLHSRSLNPDIKSLVKGVMIESYLEEGSQKIGEGVYGKSITDPCLGWDDTEKLILEMAELV